MSVLLTVLFSSHLEAALKAAAPRAPHGEGPHLLQRRARDHPRDHPPKALLPAALPDPIPAPRAGPAPLQSLPAPKDAPRPFGSQPCCHYFLFI